MQTQLMTNPASVQYAADGLIFVLAFLVGTWASWWALSALKWDLFVHRPGSSRVSFLRLMLSMICGFFIALPFVAYAIAWQYISQL